MSNPYEQDEWYEDENAERRADEAAEEFRARPFRYFYKFKTRNFVDIGACNELTEDQFRYLRYWASTGELEYWNMRRMADGITLAQWGNHPTPALSESDHDNG